MDGIRLPPPLVAAGPDAGDGGAIKTPPSKRHCHFQCCRFAARGAMEEIPACGVEMI